MTDKKLTAEQLDMYFSDMITDADHEEGCLHQIEAVRGHISALEAEAKHYEGVKDDYCARWKADAAALKQAMELLEEAQKYVRSVLGMNATTGVTKYTEEKNAKFYHEVRTFLKEQSI